MAQLILIGASFVALVLVANRVEHLYCVSASRSHVCCGSSRGIEQESILAMRERWLIAFLLLATCCFAVAPQVFINGSTLNDQARVSHIVKSLNFTKEPMPTPWIITIMSPEDFAQYTREYNLPTKTAFTILQSQHTFLNEEILRFGYLPNVRQTIAHEAGHLICECASESRANDIAWQLQQ
jgi:hypothetical protein